MFATSPTATTIDVTIEAPTTGQPWSKYLVKVCLLSNTDSCLPDKECDAAIDGAVNIETTCTVSGASANTEYSVVATASKRNGTIVTAQSTPATVQTILFT